MSYRGGDSALVFWAIYRKTLLRFDSVGAGLSRRQLVPLSIVENNIDNIIGIYYNNIVDNIFDNGGGVHERAERR